VAFNGNLTGIPASTTQNAWFAQGLSNIPNAAAGSIIGGLPNVPLQPGWQLKINVSGMDAGDQLSQITITFAPSAFEGLPPAELRCGGKVYVYSPLGSLVQLHEEYGSRYSEGSGVLSP
jgi:hypothetical protein